MGDMRTSRQKLQYDSSELQSVPGVRPELGASLRLAILQSRHEYYTMPHVTLPNFDSL